MTTNNIGLLKSKLLEPAIFMRKAGFFLLCLRRRLRRSDNLSMIPA